MDSITCTNAIRDSLRTNLTDPYVTAGGTARGGAYWIFANEPISAYKYPMIQILKVDNPTEVISIGSEYWEYEQVFLNLWFYTKNGFKITVDGTEYKNAQMTEYYLGQMKETLKAQFSTLFSAGVKGYKHVNTTNVEYDPDTQLYFGAVTIRVMFFKQ